MDSFVVWCKLFSVHFPWAWVKTEEDNLGTKQQTVWTLAPFENSIRYLPKLASMSCFWKQLLIFYETEIKCVISRSNHYKIRFNSESQKV